MSDNDRGSRRGPQRIDRSQRGPWEQDYQARDDAHEVSQRFSIAERKAHRAHGTKGPACSLESLLARLPDPVLGRVSVDDVCNETMFLVNLLDKGNVVIL